MDALEQARQDYLMQKEKLDAAVIKAIMAKGYSEEDAKNYVALKNEIESVCATLDGLIENVIHAYGWGNVVPQDNRKDLIDTYIGEIKDKIQLLEDLQKKYEKVAV